MGLSDPTPGPPDEHAGGLDALRRKIDDSAALIRRNQAAITELADSVGKLVAQQRRRERSFTLSSFVAYLIFTVLLGGAFFFLYDSRADELVAARDRARADQDVAERRAADLQAELTARDDAAAKAHAYWKLLAEGHRAEAIAQYAEVQAAALTPTERAIFAEREKQARAEIVDAGYLAGLDAFRAGAHAQAITELERALGYEQDGPRAAQMRYYLGVALAKSGRHADAATELQRALDGRVEESGVVDARYWLAFALEKLGRADDARAEYDRFAAARPQHALAWAARRKSAALARIARPRN